MIFGWGLAVLIFPEAGMIIAALLALVLSPTDAALGMAVVKNKKIPEKISQTINVESGLNDGMVLPPILFCISLSGVSGGDSHAWGYWIAFVILQLLLGALAGGLVGWIGGWIVEEASKKKWMNPTFQRMVAFSIAILAYALAELIGGNGYIAAFFAGLFLCVRTKVIRDRIQDYGETEGQQLSLFVFLIFGLVMVPWSIAFWDLEIAIYAFLSLTIIRIFPVVLSLFDSGLDTKSKLFVGWFGPRGISSILYLILIIGSLGITGNEVILSTIILTILLSIYLHGISAVPFTRWYNRADKLLNLN
jgi:NhaP-type Na+/H+ or K+/H+ antiporter